MSVYQKDFFEDKAVNKKIWMRCFAVHLWQPYGRFLVIVLA